MRRASLILASMALLLLGGHQPAAANPTLEATLSGANEIAGGDPDGSGSALISISPATNQLCFDLRVEGIAGATAAHIHKAPAGVNGGIVVPLSPPSNGSSTGCVSVDPELLRDILKHPEEYYVNVHNADYPGGALRGQLHK